MGGLGTLLLSLSLTAGVVAFGVLIFELLTGRPPFTGDSDVELFDNIQNQKVVFPYDIDGPLVDQTAVQFVKGVGSLHI